jgi:SagB-type dehydrogenase family enzyme
VPSGAGLRPDSEVRRARSLIGHWEADRLLLENYLAGRSASISPPVVQVLSDLDDFEPVGRILARLDHVPDARELLEELHEWSLVVQRDSELEAREDSLASRWPWGPDAAFFHFSTARVRFEGDPWVQRRELLQLAKSSPPPSPYRVLAGPRRPLDGKVDPARRDVWRMLQDRRTCRSFTGEAIDFERFAQIVRWTWGATHHLSDGELGDYVLKTSPSGGARHPTEVYPVVLGVEGVDPGIYHYSVRDDELVLLRSGEFRALVTRLCSDQLWLEDAAAVFFMTAVLERSAWKYRDSHAYKVLHLDAGHLGQTFHLLCTALGLGPFTTAAFQADAVEEQLALRSPAEIPIYVAAVGVPAKSPDAG